VSRILAVAEVWLAVLIVCVTCATEPPRAGYTGEVVAVIRTMGPTGEPIVRLTVAWTVQGEDGELYEQSTEDFSAASREAITLGVKGRCVLISPSADGRGLSLRACN